MEPVERKMEAEIVFLCDAGMQETVCFKLGEPDLSWYMLYDGRMVYNINPQEWISGIKNI